MEIRPNSMDERLLGDVGTDYVSMDSHNPNGDGYDSEPDVYGAICSCCGIQCCNSALCGCMACARKDKVMIFALTIVIILLIFAVVVVDLAEVSALSHAGEETENVVVATSTMLSLFRISFSFLGFGVLAMIGKLQHFLSFRLIFFFFFFFFFFLK